MARVAFLNVPAHGHTNPTLPLVRELVRRGEQVCYYSFPEFQPAIERSGAAFRSYEAALDLDYTRPDPNLFRLAATLLHTTDALLPSLLPALRRNRPDYIIHDSLCPWGRYAAHILALPAICSITTFALNARIALGSLRQAARLLGMARAAQPQLRQFRRLAAQLARTYGTPQAAWSDMFRNEAALNLVYTSDQFQPRAASFPRSYAFVGPSLDGAAIDAPLPFALPSDRRVLYISLGTLFNENVAFYRLCFDAFATMDLHVVLSIGAKLRVESLGDIPANFTVRSSVPQLAVLRRSHAFITHGGMNSVHEALYLSVPLVVVPQAADQEFVAARVPAVGAGIRLRNAQLSAAALRRAVDLVLTQAGYRRASERIGASLRAAGGPARAADEIAAFKRAHQIA